MLCIFAIVQLVKCHPELIDGSIGNKMQHSLLYRGIYVHHNLTDSIGKSLRVLEGCVEPLANVLIGSHLVAGA